jgi:AraC-like DNA-binding protein
MKSPATRFSAKIPRRDPTLGLHVHRFARLSRGYAYLHTHPEFEIAFCPHDSGFYLIEDREYRIEPGDLFIVNANDLHQPILERENNQGAVVAYLSGDVIGPDAGVGSWHVPFLIARVNGMNRLRGVPQFAALLEELHAAYVAEAPHWQGVCRGILCHLLARIAQHYESREAETDESMSARDRESVARFTRVLQHINAHLADELDVTDLYAMAGLSRSQFCERFRRAFGVSVSGYIQHLRISRAKRLLSSTELSVTEICYASGFGWLGYFNTTFRQRTGQTPGAYRRQHRVAEDEKRSR